MRNAVIAVLLLAVLVCGCVGQTPAATPAAANCTPNWVQLPPAKAMLVNSSDTCKSGCYAENRVTSYGYDKTGIMLGGSLKPPTDTGAKGTISFTYRCSCDANDCNPTTPTLGCIPNYVQLQNFLVEPPTDSQMDIGQANAACNNKCLQYDYGKGRVQTSVPDPRGGQYPTMYSCACDISGCT